MARRRLLPAILGAVLLSAPAAAPAWATGYWNLPSSYPQLMGFGFGAGRHAPLILGPVRFGGGFATNELRLPCPPSPLPYGWYGGDCCGEHFESPTLLEPVPVEEPIAPPMSPRYRTMFLP